MRVLAGSFHVKLMLMNAEGRNCSRTGWTYYSLTT